MRSGRWLFGGWCCCCCCYKYGKARSQITGSFCDMEIKYMNKMIMTYFRKKRSVRTSESAEM